MRKVLGSVFIGVTLAVATACSSEGPVTAAGTAGAGTAGMGTAGAVPSGGSGMIIGPSGGSSGAATAGGTSSVGGTVGSVAGAGGSSAGGNSATGGAAGAAGSGGQGGAGHTPVPSAGCGKLNPPEGARTIMTGGQTANYNVNVPDNYDASKPLPLGFGFHGFGNDECGPTSGECRGFAMLPAVTVYMKSISDGWEQSGVLEQNVTFFQDVLAHMKANYCVDESRVFVAGVSSGGQFVEHLTCRFGDELWQTTPVSASVVNAATMNCKGTPPVLVIHGVTDQAGNYGQGVAEMFAKRNGCAQTLPAGLEKAKTDMMAAFNAKTDQHVCLDWDGCTANPVRFCISSQITYDGLTHGWPKIGGQLIGEFQGGI